MSSTSSCRAFVFSVESANVDGEWLDWALYESPLRPLLLQGRKTIAGLADGVAKSCVEYLAFATAARLEIKLTTARFYCRVAYRLQRTAACRKIRPVLVQWIVAQQASTRCVGLLNEVASPAWWRHSHLRPCLIGCWTSNRS
jgi:hypothetical protein